MIKNNTYFEGSPHLKFERFPFYRGSDVLNKVHLDLKFIKLVSRVSTDKLNTHLLREIADNMDIELKSYTIDDNGKLSYHSYTDKKPACFVNNSTWLSVDSVWADYKANRRTIGHGLAEIRNNKDEVIGYYGYSHRGGMSFKVGDVIFDPNWHMSEFHKDFKKYKKLLNKSRYSTRIEDVIPFRERGSEVIETLAQAEDAAIKFSQYMS